MNATATPKYSFIVNERPPALGGGWRLTLLEDEQGVGGGIYPASTDEESADAYNAAAEYGQTWLDTRPTKDTRAKPALHFEPECSICAGAGKISGGPCSCTLGSQVHPNMARPAIPLAAAMAQAEGAANAAAATPFDFRAHLERQAAFSRETFGPGMRTNGICDHLRKELLEIESDPADLSE